MMGRTMWYAGGAMEAASAAPVAEAAAVERAGTGGGPKRCRGREGREGRGGEEGEGRKGWSWWWVRGGTRPLLKGDSPSLDRDRRLLRGRRGGEGGWKNHAFMQHVNFILRGNEIKFSLCAGAGRIGVGLSGGGRASAGRRGAMTRTRLVRTKMIETRARYEGRAYRGQVCGQGVGITYAICEGESCDVLIEESELASMARQGSGETRAAP